MSIKKYTLMGGGMGDILLYCLHNEFDLGYFKAIKETNPDAHTKVLLFTVNDQAKLILHANPYIDSIECHPLMGDWVKTAREIAPPFDPITDADRKTYTYERPELYLTEDEKTEANRICSLGKFVVMHPFAGDADRAFHQKINTSLAVTTIADTGIPVVVVGGDSHRVDRYTTLKERFAYDGTDVINLVGKYSVRLHSYITSKAWKFVGTVGAYNCVAAEFRIPSLLFTCDANKPNVETHDNGIFHMIREQGTEIYYWSNLPSRPIDTISRFVSNTDVTSTAISSPEQQASC